MCRITTMMPTCKISCANKALGNLTFWVCLPKNHANKANNVRINAKPLPSKTDESETFLRIVLCLFSFTFSTLFLFDHLFPLIIRALRLNSWRWGCLINALKNKMRLRQVCDRFRRRQSFKHNDKRFYFFVKSYDIRLLSKKPFI